MSSILAEMSTPVRNAALTAKELPQYGQKFFSNNIVKVLTILLYHAAGRLFLNINNNFIQLII